MRRPILVLAAAALLPFTAPSAAHAAAGPVPVASGLNNPRQLAFGPDGALYVAEAGTGRVGSAVQGGCGNGAEGKVCVGNTGSVTRIGSPGTTHGHSSARVARGFLSIAGVDGSGATGLDALAFAADGTPYGIMAYAPPSRLPRSIAWQAGQLVRDDGGRIVPVANISAYVLAHPQSGHEPDSDPYGVAVRGSTAFVVDAAGNSLLRFRDGKLSTLRSFRHRSGSEGIDAVPTSVVVGPDGMLYVGELASLIPGKAHVFVIDPSTGAVTRTISGLTSVTGLAVAPNGTVYASQMFDGDGTVAVIPRHGARYEIGAPLTGGVAYRDGHLYASVFSILPGKGAVWRF